MADLKDIKGTNVQSVDGNPTNPISEDNFGIMTQALELQGEKCLLLQLGQAGGLI